MSTSETWTSNTGSRRSRSKKRRAPPPPLQQLRPFVKQEPSTLSSPSTATRQKRRAPQPPCRNDSFLIDDRGQLRPASDHALKVVPQPQKILLASPRPWYKRSHSQSNSRASTLSSSSTLRRLFNLKMFSLKREPTPTDNEDLACNSLQFLNELNAGVVEEAQNQLAVRTVIQNERRIARTVSNEYEFLPFRASAASDIGKLYNEARILHTNADGTSEFKPLKDCVVLLPAGPDGTMQVISRNLQEVEDRETSRARLQKILARNIAREAQEKSLKVCYAEEEFLPETAMSETVFNLPLRSAPGVVLVRVQQEANRGSPQECLKRAAALQCKDIYLDVKTCGCFKRWTPEEMINGMKSACKNSPRLQLFIESSSAHYGPIFMHCCWLCKLEYVQERASRELLIPPQYQKWIIGRTLVTNFRWSLASYGIKENGCSIFLYVVEAFATRKRGSRTEVPPSEGTVPKPVVPEPADAAHGHVSPEPVQGEHFATEEPGMSSLKAMEDQLNIALQVLRTGLRPEKGSRTEPVTATPLERLRETGAQLAEETRIQMLEEVATERTKEIQQKPRREPIIPVLMPKKEEVIRISVAGKPMGRSSQLLPGGNEAPKCISSVFVGYQKEERPKENVWITDKRFACARRVGM